MKIYLVPNFALIGILLMGCDSNQKKNLYTRQEDPIAISIANIRYTAMQVGVLSLPGGNIIPLTSEEEFIIKNAAASVPFLIDALGVETNPIVIAGIANCLNIIETLDGESAARGALSRIKSKPGATNYNEVDVARKFLIRYLGLRDRQREATSSKIYNGR